MRFRLRPIQQMLVPVQSTTPLRTALLRGLLAVGVAMPAIAVAGTSPPTGFMPSTAAEINEYESRAAFVVDITDPIAEAILQKSGETIAPYESFSPDDIGIAPTTPFPTQANCPGHIRLTVGQFDSSDPAARWTGPGVRSCSSPQTTKVICVTSDCASYLVATSWMRWQTRPAAQYVPNSGSRDLGIITIREGQVDIMYFIKSGGSN